MGNYNELTKNSINMKKEIEAINKGQEEMKNTIPELKNRVEVIKNRLSEAEDWISELKDKVKKKKTQNEQEKEKRLRKNEEGLREMQDNMKHNNIHILGTPEGEEDQGIEILCETVLMENIPNLMTEKVTQFQETWRVPIKKNLKRPTSRHIILKMEKFEDKETIPK